MNCPEAQSLFDAYLDSELDARATVELREHLATCASCDQAFCQVQYAEDRLRTALRQGTATPALWALIEAALPAPARQRHRPTAANRPAHWQFWCWPSPAFHAALAAVWLLLAIAHVIAPEPDPASRSRQVTAQTGPRRALEAQRQLLAELLDLPSDASKANPRRPAEDHSAAPQPLHRA